LLLRAAANFLAPPNIPTLPRPTPERRRRSSSEDLTPTHHHFGAKKPKFWYQSARRQHPATTEKFGQSWAFEIFNKYFSMFNMDGVEVQLHDLHTPP
jgi:hypothetical protein